MVTERETPHISRSVDRLSDFTTVDRRLIFVSGAAVIVGIASTLIAVALLVLIAFFTNLFYYGRFSTAFVSPAGNSLGIFAVGIPVIGGLVVGFMARYGSERIRGHGIPEALEAILINRSKMEPRVTLLKPISTAISIGSGGPFGAEGPIIVTGGAFGSVYAQFLKVSAMERKTLLVAGAAAGMAATFNTPVAAVLLAVELLLFEFKPRSLIPVALASITATVLRGVILGTAPLFPVPATPIPDATMLLCAVLVGLIAGIVATVVTYAVYSAEDSYRKLPFHWMWWPAIGGFAVGIGGLIAPRALGVGYDTINALLLGQLALGTIGILVLTKAAIWSISLGSGTSGGVLAPLLIMGGSLGALESHFLPSGTLTLWVLVSMGAMLSGTMNVPFTGVVFALELTHDVNALLPLLGAAVVADLFTVFSLKRSIMTEKIARRGVHVAREYSVDTLELISVGSVMHPTPQLVAAGTRMLDVVDMFNKSTGLTPGFPVVDGIGHLQGMLTRSRILGYISPTGDKARDESLAARDLMLKDFPVTYPDEPIRYAADKMARYDVESIPVVDPSDHQRVVGLISREDLFHARVLWFAEERDRARFLSPRGPWKKVSTRTRRLFRRERGEGSHR